MQQPIVSIPNLTHTTVEQILAINTHLIKTLAQYQNYGWIEEPEYKIYQMRLQTNLTYLATAADYMGKPVDPSKMAVLLQPVNLASVEIPEKLRRQKEEETAAAVTAERKPGVTLAVDSNAADIDGPGEYQPVPPFANVSNTGAPMQTPPGIAPLNVLGTTDTIAEIERRFTHGGELAQNGTK